MPRTKLRGTRATLPRAAAATAAMTGLAMLTAAPPATADDASATPTYHGTWQSATADTCQLVDVTGRWSVTIKQDGTANISLTMHMGGTLHAAWGGLALGERATWVETADGYVLSTSRTTFTIAGDQVVFYIPDRYPDCDGYAYGTVG